MPPTVLKSIVAFTGLTPGVPTSLPHGVNIDGVGVVPDQCESGTAGVSILSADDTDVTVLSTGPGAADILCERWHTTPRALPPGQDDLSPQPFIPSSSSAEGGAGFPVTFIDNGILNVFVDSVSGDNANDGLTPATALEAIQEVYRKFPWYATQDAQIIINLADDGAGGVAIYPIPVLQIGDLGGFDELYRYLGPEMVAFTPSSGPAIATLDAGTPTTQVDNTDTPSGTGHRARLNFTTAAPGWTVDDFQGAFARVTRGGDLVVAEMPISKNTADTVLVDNEDVVGVLLAGDTVEIVLPGARVDGPAPVLGTVTINGPAGPAFPGGFGAPHQTTFTRISFPNLSAASGLFLSFDRCIVADLFAFFFSGKQAFANCSSPGQYVASLPRSSLSGADPFGTFLSTTGIVEMIMFNRIGVVGGSLDLEHNLSIWDSALPGSISINGGVMGVRGGVALQGITAGGGFPGIAASGNASIRLNPGDETVMTNGGGDLRVGGVQPIISYGTGAGEWEEVAGYAGIFTRVNDGTAAAPLGDGSVIIAGFAL